MTIKINGNPDDPMYAAQQAVWRAVIPACLSVKGDAKEAMKIADHLSKEFRRRFEPEKQE